MTAPTATELATRFEALIRHSDAHRAAETQGLVTIRLLGVVCLSTRMVAPWGFVMPRFSDQLTVYLHPQGAGIVHLANPRRQIALAEGDLFMVKAPTWHAISDAPGTRLVPVEQSVVLGERPASAAPEQALFHEVFGMRLRDEAPDASSAITRVITLRAFTESRNHHALLRALPDCIHLPGFWSSHRRFLETLIQELGGEGVRGLIGQAIASRIGEAIVMKIVQVYLDQLPKGQRGLMGGLKDSFIATAMNLMHSAPGHRWTVDSLARATGLSRSAFRDRFTAVVGEAPSSFLMSQRMEQAQTLLLRTQYPLARIAGDVGYGSESAFNRAFVRWCGVTPGSIRLGIQAESRKGSKPARRARDQ
jgi:AraC-like DNA-binding protein